MKILLLATGFVIGAVAVIRLTPAKPQPLKPHLDFTPMPAKFRTPKQMHQYRFMGGSPWWLDH